MAKKGFKIDNLITPDKKSISKSDFTKKIGQPKKEIVRNKAVSSYLSIDEYEAIQSIADEKMTTVSKLILLALKEQYKI